MSLNRREFLVVAAGGAGWMALNADGEDGDLVGGGGTVDDWLTVATGATETLTSGESYEFGGIDWETDGAITWEEGATLTLTQ